jgi:phenylacetate-CoA ligase
VIATGGHFMSAAIAARVRRCRWGRRKFQVVSVYDQPATMVAELNRFQPAIVLGYASAVAVLAGEQEAGRLRIRPVLVQPAGEGLVEGEYDRIAEAFGAEVRDAYSATECTFIGYSCEHRWQHVNADWVVLEPVDADHRPVPPGERSHTVLLSNLANRVQPILRYDLGDAVLQRPDPCPCGNPLPAIRVQGRSADVLTFPTGRHGSISIPPLAFGTLVDRTPGIELFQVVQTAPATLRVRLRPAPGVDPERAWTAVRAEITRLLSERGLGHVSVEHAAEPPEQSRGGKYRTVVPLQP